MHATTGLVPLTYAPSTPRNGSSTVLLPAAPGAAQRFEQLMFASPAARSAATPASALERGGLRHYVEALSRRWEAGQSSLERIAVSGEFSTQQLVQTQMQMINCALDVEVSSKCASMFENGVQTLIHRGS